MRGFEVASIEALDGGDAVIDFEVTANRPDALSVIGLAREVATAYDLPLALPSADPQAKVRLAALATGASDRVTVTIDDEELCPRYAALVAEVRVGPSPAWMAARLTAAGVRPISSIVDITNYVNLELGQPMHAFDLARLAGPEIHARRAKPGEKITTLDGVVRTLEPDMLVIADRDRPQAVGGVMGGADSEVSSATATVVFESAYFKPASVRRTSKRLGLKTEASSRFERGGDPGASGDRDPARDRADAADRRRPAGRIDRRRLPAAASSRSVFTCGATGSRACSARRCPTPRSCGSCAGSGLTSPPRPTAGTRSRRPSASICCARPTSSRRSAATTASTSSSRRSRS